MKFGSIFYYRHHNSLLHDPTSTKSHHYRVSSKPDGQPVSVGLSGNQVGANSELPLWVVLAAHSAIALGTLSGGWRIVKTMGSKITKLQPQGGVCAETAGALTLFATSIAGIPVSTTHTITGAIVGVGSARRISAVRWNVATRVVWAWVLTIPAAGVMAAGTFYVVSWLK